MKYCSKCGASVEDGVSFCERCGAPIETAAQENKTLTWNTNETATENTAENASENTNPTPVGVPSVIPNAAAQYSGKSIAGFVLSIVGFFVAGLICGTLGIIFSALGLNDFKKTPSLKGKGLAIAGLVISIADVALLLLSMMNNGVLRII